MSRWRSALDRALTVLDRVFDGGADLMRVLLRGRFAPDGRSFRERRYLELAPTDVLVQPILLNAEDAAQAQRILALEPDRWLPLRGPEVVFDVAGPLGPAAPSAGSADRRFLLGLTRRDVLANARMTGPRRRVIPIEGFTHHPADHPAVALRFSDTAGDRSRRTRRLLLLAAAVAAAWSAQSAALAWREALGRAATEAEAEQLRAQRQIRLLQRRLAENRLDLAAVKAAPPQPVGKVLDTLATLGRALPPGSELTSLDWSPSALALKGRSYAPEGFELQLRRAFTRDGIEFEAGPPANPTDIDARIALAGPAPDRRDRSTNPGAAQP